MGPALAQATELTATVTGLDLERDASEEIQGRPPRSPRTDISIPILPARHGHKTFARGFDGYKGHGASTPTRRSLRHPGSRRRQQRRRSR
jgi:hypothetical protein